MTKKHRKPTGEMGHVLKLSSTGISKVELFKFPNTKEEIEEKISTLFLKIIETSDTKDLKGLNLKKNSEYDLDFCLTSDKKQYLLELTEFTPPGKMKGGYQKLAYSHNVGEHAQKIIDLIQKKSDKYSSISTEIILLAYISDQRSLTSISTETIIKQYLITNDHVFKYIFLIIPIMENDGPLIMLYPNNEKPLPQEIIDEIKKDTVHNLKLE